MTPIHGGRMHGKILKYTDWHCPAPVSISDNGTNTKLHSPTCCCSSIQGAHHSFKHKSQPCPVWSQRTILSLFHRTVISGTPWQIWAKQLQGPFAAGSKLTYFLLFFSLQSMTKYGALSSASFRPKSDKERKGMTKIPFLLWIVGITGKSNICTLWAFSK